MINIVNYGRSACLFLAFIAAVALTGCSRQPDLYVLVTDSRGVQKDAPVAWQGLTVGTVSDVATDAGKVKISAKLEKDYRGRIKTGVKARPMNTLSPYDKPVLLLLGGSDAEAIPLPKNSQVPEATMLEALKYTSFLDWFTGMGYATSLLPIIVVAILVLLILGKFMKGMLKILMFLLAIALLVLSLWFAKYQWDKYKTTIASPEFISKVDNFIGYDFKSPEAREAWEQMKNDLAAIKAQAGEKGSDAYNKARKSFEDKISRIIDDLKSQGKGEAVKELEAARLMQ